MNRAYEILGLGIEAGDGDVRRAWRRLARKYHPDVSGEREAAARFREARAAYEALRDPQGRAAWRTARAELRRRRAERDAETMRRVRLEARLSPRTRHEVADGLRRGVAEPACGYCGAPERTRATCACASWERTPA